MRFAPVSRNLNKLLDIRSLKMLDNYAQFNPVPLSIEQFLQFGQRALETESYHFLKKVRLKRYLCIYISNMYIHLYLITVFFKIWFIYFFIINESKTVGRIEICWPDQMIVSIRGIQKS